MMSSLGALQRNNKDGIAKQLERAATALQAQSAVPPAPHTSLALRLAEAARVLEEANKKYKWAYEAKQAAELKAQKAK